MTFILWALSVCLLCKFFFLRFLPRSYTTLRSCVTALWKYFCFLEHGLLALIIVLKVLFSRENHRVEVSKQKKAHEEKKKCSGPPLQALFLWQLGRFCTWWWVCGQHLFCLTPIKVSCQIKFRPSLSPIILPQSYNTFLKLLTYIYKTMVLIWVSCIRHGKTVEMLPFPLCQGHGIWGYVLIKVWPRSHIL